MQRCCKVFKNFIFHKLILNVDISEINKLLLNVDNTEAILIVIMKRLIHVLQLVDETLSNLHAQDTATSQDATFNPLWLVETFHNVKMQLKEEFVSMNAGESK